MKSILHKPQQQKNLIEKEKSFIVFQMKKNLLKTIYSMYEMMKKINRKHCFILVLFLFIHIFRSSFPDFQETN